VARENSCATNYYGVDIGALKRDTTARGLIAVNACERQLPLVPLKSTTVPLYSWKVYVNAESS
jgi:hypothetical protein